VYSGLQIVAGSAQSLHTDDSALAKRHEIPAITSALVISDRVRLFSPYSSFFSDLIQVADDRGLTSPADVSGLLRQMISGTVAPRSHRQHPSTRPDSAERVAKMVNTVWKSLTEEQVLKAGGVFWTYLHMVKEHVLEFDVDIDLPVNSSPETRVAIVRHLWNAARRVDALPLIHIDSVSSSPARIPEHLDHLARLPFIPLDSSTSIAALKRRNAGTLSHIRHDLRELMYAPDTSPEPLKTSLRSLADVLRNESTSLFTSDDAHAPTIDLFSVPVADYTDVISILLKVDDDNVAMLNDAYREWLRLRGTSGGQQLLLVVRTE
jgi:hypothetical protein